MSSILTFAVLLGTPLLGALLLGLLGAKRWAPTLNVVFSALTFLAACVLTSRVITHGNLVVMNEQFFIDAFNVFMVTLTAFVGLTTSIFSRPYMRIEAEHGRVSPAQLRLYHSMYQLFMATMLLALTTNNLGLMWVAMEAATLSTVLLVTLYRTPAWRQAGSTSFSAAWALRRHCSARSCCTSPRKKSSAPRASAHCCGRISTS